MKKRALAFVMPAMFIGLTSLTADAQPAANQPRGGPAPAAANVVYDAAAVPAGTYVVDHLHSALTGSVRHSGLSHFVFRFKRFDAKFTYDPAKPDAPSIEVTIDPASFDTNVQGFDTDLVTSDRYFNVAKFPAITFVSNSLKRTGPDKGVMSGTITFLGVSKPLDFDVTFLGVAKARNGASVGFSATTTIYRSDFGMATGSGDLDDIVSVAVEADFMQQRPPQ